MEGVWRVWKVIITEFHLKLKKNAVSPIFSETLTKQVIVFPIKGENISSLYLAGFELFLNSMEFCEFSLLNIGVIYSLTTVVHKLDLLWVVSKQSQMGECNYTPEVTISPKNDWNQLSDSKVYFLHLRKYMHVI